MSKSILSPIVLIIAFIAGTAATMSSAVRDRDNVSVEVLEVKAKQYVMNGGRADSAIWYLGKIISTLSGTEKFTDKQKNSLAKAYNNVAYIAMFHLSDYERALQNLLAASELQPHDSIMATVDYNFGNIYNFYSYCFPLSDNKRRADSFMRTAFRRATHAGKQSVALGAYRYLADAAFGDNVDSKALAELDSMMRAVRHMHPTEDLRTDLTTLSALHKIKQGDYAQAARIIHTQMPGASDISTVPGRGECMVLWRLLNIYKMAGQQDSTLYYGRKLYTAAAASGLSDIESNAAYELAEAFSNAGIADSVAGYRLRYYQLRDSLLIGRRLANVDSGYLMYQLEDANRQTERERWHRTIQWIIIAVIGLALLSSAAVLWILQRKNRELRSRNEALFDRLQETDTKPMEVKHAEESQPQDNAAKELTEKIETALSDSRLLSDSTLTLDRLATHLDIPAKRLSQFVNEHYEGTFATLLQERRCRLACRMMNEDTDRKYTVEAFSLNVGFNSRTAFIRAFKKVIGMTPSEYLRIARQRTVSQ